MSGQEAQAAVPASVRGAPGLAHGHWTRGARGMGATRTCGGAVSCCPDTSVPHLVRVSHEGALVDRCRGRGVPTVPRTERGALQQEGDLEMPGRTGGLCCPVAMAPASWGQWGPCASEAGQACLMALAPNGKDPSMWAAPKPLSHSGAPPGCHPHRFREMTAPGTGSGEGMWGDQSLEETCRGVSCSPKTLASWRGACEPRQLAPGKAFLSL